MDVEHLQQEKRQLVSQYGNWTAHNIQLVDDLYTIDNKIIGDEEKLRRIVQVVSDAARRPLSDLRILDLACLEGLYSIEFARHGAEVLAIEGRQANIEKARFVKRALSLENVEFIQEDVRNLSRDKFGCFDVVLCLGILYHLDGTDVFEFLKHISDVCSGLTVVDTHVSLRPEKSVIYDGKEYWGRTYQEHEFDATPEQRERELWASLDNPTSFWLTRPSLYNLLAHVGFTSVYECYVPQEPEKPDDRVTILAVKGEPRELICCPLLNAELAKDLLEQCRNNDALKLNRQWRPISRVIPGPAKRLMRRWLFS